MKQLEETTRQQRDQNNKPPSESSDMDLKKELRVFILSGFTREKKRDLKAKIKTLGGQVWDDMVFSVECTHVICQKPCRSEKFLSGLATGKWILTEYYINQSFLKGRWLSEQPYEWGCQPYAGTCSEDLLQAPKRARLRYGKDNDPAFSCWKAGLLLTDQPRVSVYKRLLRCGGAQVVALKAPTSTRLRLPPGLTHVFADQTQRRLAVQLAQAGVQCLEPSYIGDFLTGVETPCKRHFVYFPESNNYCCATATVAQRSFKKKDSSCATLISEGVPKQAAVTANRCKRKFDEHRENEPPPTTYSSQSPCVSSQPSSGHNVSMTSTLANREPITSGAKGVANKVDDRYSLSEDTQRSLSVPFEGTKATSEAAPVCNSLDFDAGRTDADTNQAFSRTIRSCLEENRSADVMLLLQSYMRPDSTLSDSSLLSRIMAALQCEKDVAAGKRYCEMLHQISAVIPPSGFEAAIESVGSERVRAQETVVLSGSTQAWCLISFLFSALLDPKSKVEPGLRTNRLLLLQFLAELFVKDSKTLHDQKPSRLLLYRIMWLNSLYVNISRGPGAALLTNLSKSLTAKDIELTRISLQLINLLPRLCGVNQSDMLARQIASSIRSGAFCDHHFLTLILSELSSACFKNKVCEFVLNIVTNYEGRQRETADAMTVTQMAKRYCCIPSGASVYNPTADEQSFGKSQPTRNVGNHLAKTNSTDCEKGVAGSELRRSASADKSPDDHEVVTCSFDGCCCREPGLSADLVAGYLLVLFQLVVTFVEIRGAAHPAALSDQNAASRLALFVSEHVRHVERCMSQGTGRSTISSDDLEDLQAIPSVLRALLPCT